MSREDEMPEIREGLVLHPGDKLLVRVDSATDPAIGQAFRDQLRERLPEVDVIVVAAEQIAKVTP